MSVQVEIIVVTALRGQTVQILLGHICAHAETVMKVMEGLVVFQQVNG